MATLPPMMAGLPAMQMPQPPPPAQQPQPVDPMQPMQPMHQPSQPLTDPFVDVEQSAAFLKGTVDDDMLSDFIDQAAVGGDIVQLADKAVTASFKKGVNDLTKLLGDYSTKDFSNDMQNARSALQSFMKDNNGSKEKLEAYRQAIRPLTQVPHRIRNISNRPDQSRFIKAMQDSKDQVVNQMITDITQQDPNGNINLEYLITGKAPKSVPKVLLDNQSHVLWQKIVTTITNGITNQIEALLQRDITGTLRSEAMQNGIANAQQTVMSTIQPMQQKIMQIQQVHAPIFQTTENIRPTENIPIQRMALNRYANP